jgi:ribonuclease HI
MEMTAAIKALEALPLGASVTLHSDSQIVIKGMNEWLAGWKAKEWRNSQRQPVANQDLWRLLDTLNAGRLITWIWVKGHAGHVQNERVDGLADGLADAEAQKAAEAIGWTEGYRYTALASRV